MTQKLRLWFVLNGISSRWKWIVVLMERNGAELFVSYQKIICQALMVEDFLLIRETIRYFYHIVISLKREVWKNGHLQLRTFCFLLFQMTKMIALNHHQTLSKFIGTNTKIDVCAFDTLRFPFRVLLSVRLSILRTHMWEIACSISI